MPDLDLLDFVSADHLNLTTDVDAADMPRAIEKHVTMERALLY